MEPNASQAMAADVFFKFVLGRIDRAVFGKASMICTLRSGTPPMGLFRTPVSYFHSKEFLEQQKGWVRGSRTDFLIPEHDFFLLHPVPFKKRVEDFRKADPDFAPWTLKGMLAQMALNRMWHKFQMRQELLFRTGRIPAMKEVSGEAIAGSIEPLDELGILEEERAEVGQEGEWGEEEMAELEGLRGPEIIEKAIEARREEIRELVAAEREQPADMTSAEWERGLRREAEYDIVGLVSRAHFAASERCAVRFLRRVMAAVEPRVLKASADG